MVQAKYIFSVIGAEEAGAMLIKDFNSVEEGVNYCFSEEMTEAVTNSFDVADLTNAIFSIIDNEGHPITLAVLVVDVASQYGGSETMHIHYLNTDGSIKSTDRLSAEDL